MNQDNTRRKEALLEPRRGGKPGHDCCHAAPGASPSPDSPIFSSSDHLTPFCPLATSENPMVAPTMQCVPEMGSFKNEATSCHTAEPGRQKGGGEDPRGTPGRHTGGIGAHRTWR